jgi:hypothetical protein
MDWPRSIGISCSNLKGYVIIKHINKDLFGFYGFSKIQLKVFTMAIQKMQNFVIMELIVESKDNVTYIIRCNL